MGDERRQVGKLQELAALRQLRLDVAANRLAGARRSREAAQSALRSAEVEEAEVRWRLGNLLQAQTFGCGEYVNLLEILHAQSTKVWAMSEQVAHAEAAEGAASDEYWRADVEVELLRRAIARQRRQLGRKDLDRLDLQNLDRHNIQWEARTP